MKYPERIIILIIVIMIIVITAYEIYANLEPRKTEKKNLTTIYLLRWYEAAGKPGPTNNETKGGTWTEY